MCKNLEQLLIYHCAPTLAGIKAANLFCYPYTNIQDLENNISNLQKLLASKGLSLKTLRLCNSKCQIYIYRQAALKSLLGRKDIQAFLKNYGYPVDNSCCIKSILEHLVLRFNSCNEFPHEIGIFLAYPLEDVKQFILHGGKHFACCGCWKAYTDVNRAKKLFAQYTKCRRVYLQSYKNGTSISRLLVA